MYRHHLGLSENEIKELYTSLVDTGFVSEHTKTVRDAFTEAVFGVLTAGVSLIAGGVSAEDLYKCSTFK